MRKPQETLISLAVFLVHTVGCYYISWESIVKVLLSTTRQLNQRPYLGMLPPLLVTVVK